MNHPPRTGCQNHHEDESRHLAFGRFTMELLAGVLLPGATLDQKIASGFRRDVMVNFEGGADPAEYLTKYIVDRVTTTATVFLGSTLACTECHDKLYTSSRQHKAVTKKQMQQGKSCGACHNGKKAFSVKGDCAKCHMK